jgi:hypothetical protein
MKDQSGRDSDGGRKIDSSAPPKGLNKFAVRMMTMLLFMAAGVIFIFPGSGGGQAGGGAGGGGATGGGGAAESAAPAGAGAMTCSISIGCATIFDNMDSLAPGKEAFLPQGGVILAEADVELLPGESALDVLARVAKDRGIDLELSSPSSAQRSHVKGIGGIYESDCGAMSSWMYKVNGEFPDYGAGQHVMEDRDALEWTFTCDLGRDVGGASANQKQGRRDAVI